MEQPMAFAGVNAPYVGRAPGAVVAPRTLVLKVDPPAVPGATASWASAKSHRWTGLPAATCSLAIAASVSSHQRRRRRSTDVVRWITVRQARKWPKADAVTTLEPDELQDEQDEQEDTPDSAIATNAKTQPPWPLWQGINDQMEVWGGLRIPTRLRDALKERGIVQPAPIQSLVLPKQGEGENIIIHAPTGGGKTLSFLIPMLARLKPTLHVGCQALVFVPTPELAVQTTRELRWLFEALSGPDRACWFNPQVPRELGCEVLLSRKALWDAMRQDTAVIVTTPSILLSELEALEWQAKKFMETLSYFMCSNLHCIVMDEVDAMCKSNSPRKNPKHKKVGAMEQVLYYLIECIRQRYRNRPVQMVSASATANSHKVSKLLHRVQEAKWPKRRDVARRKAPILIQHGERVDEMHIGAEAGGSWVRVPETITHCLASTGFESEDDRFGKERLNLVTEIVKKLQGTVLLFLPERLKLDGMVVILREAGLDASKYRSLVGLGLDTEELDQKKELVLKRKGDYPLSELAASSEYALRRGKELAEELAKGGNRILVAKADTVRGMDLENVSHVVLAEFPAQSMDYMHLAGRTGRMGRSGTVISVVSPMEKKLICDIVQPRLGISFNGWDIEDGKVVPLELEDEEERQPPLEEGEEGFSSDAPVEQEEAMDSTNLGAENTSAVDDVSNVAVPPEEKEEERTEQEEKKEDSGKPTSQVEASAAQD